MMPLLTLTIPGRWPSSNEFYEQRHWSARSATIHDCHDRVWAALHEVDDLPALPLAGVVGIITVVHMTPTIQDADNVLAKAVIDGLVRAGVLELLVAVDCLTNKLVDYKEDLARKIAVITPGRTAATAYTKSRRITGEDGGTPS